MMIKSYLQLVRLPAVLTTITNILAGYFIAYPLPELLVVEPLLHLILVSILLYASGMILNDYYDQEEDKKHKKKKPLISGEISPPIALFLGYSFQILGLILAYTLSTNSAFVALIIVLFINAYDLGMKHYKFFGGATMAACRFMNILLGMSLFLEMVPPEKFIFPILLFCYVFCLTRISQMEEIQENKTRFGILGFCLVLIPMLTCLLSPSPLKSLPFAGLLVFKLATAIHIAWFHYRKRFIIAVVKTTVLGVVLMDAIVLAGHQQIAAALICFGILCISSWITKWIST